MGSNDAEDYGHEWGYSLLPSTMLFKEHFLGWAPDAYPPAAGETDMGAFLSVAQDNTTVFVDYEHHRPYLHPQSPPDPVRRQPDDRGPVGGALLGDRPVHPGLRAERQHRLDHAPRDLGYVAIPGTDFISLVLA